MVRVSALALAGVAVACGSTQAPRYYPNFIFPDIVVTEGGSTTFPLQLMGTPDFEMGGMMYTGDRDVALVTPALFDITPSDYAVQMTVTGIDDMMAAGNRATDLNGQFDNNGTYGGGVVRVADRQSQNVLSDSWSVVLTPSATSTFSLHLAMQPTAAETINVEPLAPGNDPENHYRTDLVSFTPTAIVFSPADYSVPQVITVSSGADTGRELIGLFPADVNIPVLYVAVTITQ